MGRSLSSSGLAPNVRRQSLAAGPQDRLSIRDIAIAKLPTLTPQQISSTAGQRFASVSIEKATSDNHPSDNGSIKGLAENCIALFDNAPSLGMASSNPKND